ncbi:hypothetical protein ABEG17_02895 [Pedococcus sp. KACC 23699]|uniref:Uncharacterized protein n=1 Tax=Pedococcus sp. KACC 23699 TaxID=3149228 RepID=A0AAU7JVJ7_9MICO
MVQVSTPHVVQWGWFSIELTNLLIILVMIVVFVLALLLPFPHNAEVTRERRGEQP